MTLLVTCWHGRGKGSAKWKDHGSDTANSNQTWFIALGPDTPLRAIGEIKEGQYSNNQHAKTIAALVGFGYKTENLVGTAIDLVLEKKVK